MKEPASNAGDPGHVGLIPGWEDAMEEEMANHSSILPGDSSGQRSLPGYSPLGCKESDRAEVTEHARIDSL